MQGARILRNEAYSTPQERRMKRNSADRVFQRPVRGLHYSDAGVTYTEVGLDSTRRRWSQFPNPDRRNASYRLSKSQKPVHQPYCGQIGAKRCDARRASGVV